LYTIDLVVAPEFIDVHPFSEKSLHFDPQKPRADISESPLRIMSQLFETGKFKVEMERVVVIFLKSQMDLCKDNRSLSS